VHDNVHSRAQITKPVDKLYQGKNVGERSNPKAQMQNITCEQGLMDHTWDNVLSAARQKENKKNIKDE